jgi:hypothetical protein
VAGATWRAATRIVTGVGDLVQRTGDGRTGWKLDGRVIERSGGIVCGLYRARGDEEREFLGWASKPRSTICQWFGLKTTGTICKWFDLKTTQIVSHRFGPQNRWRRFVSGLTSKSLGRFSPVWPQNRWWRFLAVLPQNLYKLGLGYERCENKSEISTKFVPSSTYKDEEEILKGKQISYPANPMPSFNPKRAQKQTTNPSMLNLDGVYTCMFCGCVGHLVEFCFWRKRMGKRHVDYARNSYHEEFFDFPSRSYSRVSPRTSSRALSCFSHGPNHRSYGFCSRENNFVPRRFGYGPRFPHHGDSFPRRPSIPAGASHTHFELRYLESPHFPHRGLCPTQPNGEVKRTMKTFSGCMVKCWIHKIYLTHPSVEPSTSSHPM